MTKGKLHKDGIDHSESRIAGRRRSWEDDIDASWTTKDRAVGVGALLGRHSCKRTKPLRLAAAAASFAKPTRKTCQEPDAKHAPDVQDALL